MSIGGDKIQKLRELGASEAEIAAWEQAQREKMTKLGVTPVEQDTYFGRGPLDLSGVDNMVSATLDALHAPEAETGTRKRLTVLEGLEAGWQLSVTGLQSRGELPDIALGEDEAIWTHIAAAVGQTIGDLPVSIPAFIAGAIPGAKGGAVAGGAAGAVVGGVGAAPGAAVGAVVGGAVAGGIASGAATEGLRSALIDFYTKNEDQDVTPRDFAVGMVSSILRKETLDDAAFGGAVGGATGLVGGVARPLLAPVGSVAMRELAIGASEMGASVAAVAAIEGRLPTKEDFAVATGVFLGYKTGELAAVKGTKAFKEARARLEAHYVRTGEDPIHTATRAAENPAMYGDIIAGDSATGPNATIRETRATSGWEGIIDLDGAVSPVDDLIFNPSEIGDAAAKAAADAPTNHSAVVAAGRPVPKRSGGDGGGNEPPPGRRLPAPEDGPQGTKLVRNLEDDIKSITDRVVPDKKRWRYDVDDFRYDFIDDLQYATSFSAKAYKAATGKRLSFEENPGELMHLAAGAHSKAELELKQGIFDPKTGKKVGKGFKEILDSVPEADRGDFRAFLIAERIVEKEAQGFKTGFDKDAAANVAKAFGGRKDFRDAAAQLQEWLDHGLKRLVEAGMLSKEQAERHIEMNRNYVPFARQMDDGTPPPGVTRRGFPVRKATRKFEGSERDIFDPIEVMVKNRYALTQISENNLARQRLIEFNDQLPAEFQFIRRLTPKEPEPPRKRSPKDIDGTAEDVTNRVEDRAAHQKLVELAEADPQTRRFMEDNGITPEDVSPVVAYQAAIKRMDSGEFIVFEDGKPITYQADDPRLVRSLQSLDRVSTNILLKIMSLPSSAMRAGSVLAPDFMLRSTFRDAMGALTINHFKTIPVWDQIVGAGHIFKRSTDYIKWLESGGANSALLDLDRRILSNGFLDDATVKQGVLPQAWNVISTPYRALAYVSVALDNATRVGQFVRAQAEGADIQTAAMRSRRVNLDFHRMGARIRAYNSISAFIGASINGTDRLYQAFRENPKRAALVTAASVTVPSILLWWANHDEQWYQELPEWEKAAFWHFNTGSAEDPTIVRIPMPIGTGATFGYAPTRVLDAYVKDNPGAWGDINDAILSQLIADPAPVMLSPLVEIGANHNFFTGAPLVSRSLETVLPEYRYTPFTSETAKTLAKAVAPFAGGLISERYATPVAIDHLIRAWTGSLGAGVLSTLDIAADTAGLTTAPRPAMKLTDIPFVRGFFSRHPTASAELDKFYDNADRSDQYRRTIQEMFKQGRAEEGVDLQTRYSNVMLRTAPTREAISNMRAAINGIYYHPDIPPAEKRQLIDDYTRLMTETARMFNEIYREAEKQ